MKPPTKRFFLLALLLCAGTVSSQTDGKRKAGDRMTLTIKGVA